jgi:hypothetical protein
MVFCSSFDINLKASGEILNVYGSPDTNENSKDSLVYVKSSSPSPVS